MQERPTRSRFLPNFPQPVYISKRPPDPAKDVARMLSRKEAYASVCPEVSSGRTLVVSSPLQPTLVDISLCNIMGVGADYLYVASSNKLYVLLDPVLNIPLLLASVLVVYLMIVMGHNLQVVLGASSAAVQKKKRGFWTVLCMILLVIISCFFCTSSHSVLGAYVTLEDTAAFLCMLAYVVYHSLRILADVAWGTGRRGNAVNPMLASIWMAVQRVYGSAENPYSAVLFFIMLTWTLHKISILVYRCEMANFAVQWWRSVDIMADCVLLSVLAYAGVVGQMQMESSNAVVNVLQGLLAGMTLNRAVMPLHFALLRKMQIKV